MSPLLIILCSFLIGVNALSTPAPDDQNLDWTKLIKCNKFLSEFKRSIAAYRQCLRTTTRTNVYDQEFWARMPTAVETCKAMEPWVSTIEVESIDKDDRGPLWFIRPTGHDSGPFTMVIIERHGRHEAAERELRKSIPQMQHHHGTGVTFILAWPNQYNFSSIGKFQRESQDECFDIESQSPGKPLHQPTPDMSPVDLLLSDDKVFSIPPNIEHVTSTNRHRGYLIFDGKQIDESHICQISIRRPRFKLNATNGSLWIPDLPLPTTRMCYERLSYVLRFATDRPFVPIRSGYYSTANNETYFNEFFINVDNPKCVAKYLANRAEVGKCEPQLAEKGSVKNDRFEMESEVHMIEG